jgi:tetratricopeptide (TPR) repeat protein
MRRLLVVPVSVLLVAGLVFSQAYRGKARIKGLVKDADGQGVPQVTVKLYHVSSDSGFEVMTDERGEWIASWLRNGLWNIDFQKEGYLPRRISVAISEIKRNPDVEVVLKKARSPLVPKELLDKLDQGNKLFDEGRYDEAIAYFENILTARPEFYQININIGNAYMKKEDYRQALASFQKVLEKDPQNVEALISSGNCNVELKENDKAIALFKQIDKNDITDATTLYNIGTIFYNNGEVDMAIQYYEQSIVVQNDFVESYYQLGLAYLGHGDKENSLKNFQKYLEIDSTSQKAEQVKKFIEFLQKNES